MRTTGHNKTQKPGSIGAGAGGLPYSKARGGRGFGAAEGWTVSPRGREEKEFDAEKKWGVRSN